MHTVARWQKHCGSVVQIQHAIGPRGAQQCVKPAPGSELSCALNAGACKDGIVPKQCQEQQADSHQYIRDAQHCQLHHMLRSLVDHRIVHLCTADRSNVRLGSHLVRAVKVYSKPKTSVLQGWPDIPLGAMMLRSRETTQFCGFRARLDVTRVALAQLHQRHLKRGRNRARLLLAQLTSRVHLVSLRAFDLNIEVQLQDRHTALQPAALRLVVFPQPRGRWQLIRTACFDTPFRRPSARSGLRYLLQSMTMPVATAGCA